MTSGSARHKHTRDLYKHARRFFEAGGLGTQLFGLWFRFLATGVGLGKDRDDEFADKGLPIGHQAAVAGGQAHQIGEFHPLQRGLDAPQGMAAQRNLVRGEDQPEGLFLAVSPEFREGELVEGQEKTLLSRYFDFDCASVRIARPTFWRFCAHKFVRVDDGNERV